MEKLQNNLVYGLRDPATGHLRYIGKSTSGLTRPRQHLNICCLNREKSYKANWIRSLIRIGLLPEIVVIQSSVDSSILSDCERFWIVYFRGMGCPLTNLTDGGDGPFGRLVSEHERSLKSRMFRGRTPALSTRLAVVKANAERKGVWHPVKNELHKRALSKARGFRPIVELTTGRVFQTRAEAARELGVNAGNIGSILKGRLKSTKGYSFRFLEDHRAA